MTLDLGLNGKHVLITGGSHGIGLAAALAFAAEGGHVAICARGMQRLDEARTRILATGGRCLAIAADVMVPDDCDRVVDTVLDEWGSVDVLVNNAGGGGRWGSDDILATPERVWGEVYDKNVNAAVRFTLRVLPSMMRKQWGRVITVSSVHGKQAGGRPWFNIAKCAETVLMKNLSMKPEFTRCGVTFNSIAPGCIMIPDTGWHQEKLADPERFARMVEMEFPLGRLGTPEEVADVIVYVSSQRASLVNGASIVVDGGECRVF